MEASMASTDKSAHKPACIYDMMEHLGIEPGGGLVPCLSLSHSIAFHRCEACTSRQACRDWLDSMPASIAVGPRFCPNADIFFELQVDQPGPRGQI
jgi:hypothetical protein